MTDMTHNTAAPKRDNLLGVCHAIGDSFGFNPLYMRLAFVASVLVDFEFAIGVYLALAIAVVMARR